MLGRFKKTINKPARLVAFLFPSIGVGRIKSIGEVKLNINTVIV